jgi:hypothetical protein
MEMVGNIGKRFLNLISMMAKGKEIITSFEKSI